MNINLKTISLTSLLIMTISLLNCTTIPYTKKVETSKMSKGQKYNQIFLQKNAKYESLKYSDSDINKLVKTSLETVSTRKKLLEEVNVFGKYKSHMLKDGRILSHDFRVNGLKTSFYIDENSNNIKKIEITPLNSPYTIRKKKINILDNLNFNVESEFINYGLHSQSNHYNVIFKTAHPHYPNAIIELLYSYNDKEKADEVSRKTTPPENIDLIIIYPKNPELLKPYETIGKID